MRTVERWFEDYDVGESRVSSGRTITESDIVWHAGQTGDFFPHHMDAAWTERQPFGERIAHGTLVLSVAVGMMADEINPQSLSYGYDRIRFLKPVFIGDTLTVKTEIVGKSDHAKRPEKHGYLHELLVATNQRHEEVLVLTHLYLVNKRAAAGSGG